MSNYYDREGEPITPLEWAELFNDADYKIIQQDRPDGMLISTVWRGDTNPEGEPAIFETAVFNTTEGEDGFEVWENIYRVRYHTQAEAESGHEFAKTLYGV